MRVQHQYPTLSMGVSRAADPVRKPGYFWDEVNMVSDPQTGVSRRQGTVLVSDFTHPSVNVDYGQNTLGDFEGWRLYEFSFGGKDYDILYRPDLLSGGYGATSQYGILIFNKTDRAWVTSVTGRPLPMQISAITSVGRYVFFQGRQWDGSGGPGGAATVVDHGGLPAGAKASIHVRAGLPGRLYKLRFIVKQVGGLAENTVEVSYQCPKLEYDGPVTPDLPGLQTTDPLYTQKASAQQLYHQRIVNQHAVFAARFSAPSAVIAHLVDRLQSHVAYNGFFTLSHTVNFVADINSAVDNSPPWLAISAQSGWYITGLEFTDGGSGEAVRAVAYETDAVEKLPRHALPGHRVKISPGKGAPPFFMRAEQDGTGIKWVESAERSVTAPSQMSRLVVADDNTWSCEQIPMDPMKVGALADTPVPHFVGRRITFLGVFQDRLLVGAGGMLAASQVGKYTNFWRSTMLTLPADDPVEFTSSHVGSDVFRHAVPYRDGLMVFGDEGQYFLSGKVPLTPTNAAIYPVGRVKGVSEVLPQALGQEVYYASENGEFADVGIFTPGGLDGSVSRAFSITDEIPQYVRGKPKQLAAVIGPKVLLLRAQGSPRDLYVFQYQDSQDGRKMAAWKRWEFSPSLGSLFGIGRAQSNAFLYFVYANPVTGKVGLAVHDATFDPALSRRPYLDGLKPYGSLQGWWQSTSQDIRVATGSDVAQSFLGGTGLAAAIELLAKGISVQSMWTGATYTSGVYPERPLVRDQNGAPLLEGDLTVSYVHVKTSVSGGIYSELQEQDPRSGQVNTTTFHEAHWLLDGVLVGASNYGSKDFHIMLGKQSRRYRLGILSHEWMPLTLDSISWTGQFFNRTRRV